MNSTLLERALVFLRAQRKKKIWYRLMSCMAAVVVFITTYMLILPAITMEREAYCGLEEHVHSEECYDEAENLICEKDQHIHNENCYLEEDTGYSNYSSGEDDAVIDNTSDEIIYDPDYVDIQLDDFYGLEEELEAGEAENETESETEPETEAETEEYICGLAEHTHTVECFDENEMIICRKEEHIHSVDCLPEAEMETETAGEPETEAKTEMETASEAESESEAEYVTETVTEATQESQMEGVTEAGRENAGASVGDAAEIETTVGTEDETVNEIDTEAVTEIEEIETESAMVEFAICGVEEHIHTEACYNEAHELFCTLEEHQHTEDCYITVAEFTLPCGMTAHMHNANCYDEEGVLICNLKEHEHSMACVMILNEDADIMTLEESGDSEVPKDLTPYLTKVTGSGTKLEQGTNYYTSDLRIDFTVDKSKVLSDGYNYVYQFPDGIIVPDRLLGKSYRGYDESNGLAFTYDFVKDSNGRYAVNVHFNQEYVDKAGATIECFIAFHGQLNGSGTGENGNIKFEFSTGLELQIPPEEVEYPENEKLNYDISVSKSGSYKAADGKLRYEVIVESKKGTPAEIVLSDVLTHNNFSVKDLTVVSVEEYKKAGQWDAAQIIGELSASDYTIFSNTDTFTLTLPRLDKEENVYSKQYKIVYEYTLDELPENATVNANNAITANSGKKEEGNLVVDNSGTSVSITKTMISKRGAFNSKENKIHWVITINGNNENIAGSTVTDEMFSKLSGDNLKITLADGSAAADGAYTINADADGKVTGILFNEINDGENKQTYTIEYDTEALPGWNNSEIKNTATYTSGGGADSTAEGTVTVPSSGSIGKELINSGTPVNGVVETLWRAAINIPEDGLDKDISFKDWLSPQEKHWITKKQLTGMVLTNEWIGSSMVSFEDGSANFKPLSEWETWAANNSYTEDSKLRAFGITIPKEVGNQYKGQTLYFEYGSYCDISDVIDTNAIYTNTLEEVGGSHKVDAIYEYSHKSKVLKMDGAGNKNESSTVTEDGSLTWRVKIALESDVTSLTVTDTLPENVGLTSLAYGEQNSQVDAVLSADGVISASSDALYKISGTYNKENRQIILNVGIKDEAEVPDTFKAGGEFWVTYHCMLDESILESIKNGQPTNIGKFTNAVSVKVDNSEGEYGSSNQTQEVTVSKPEIEKMFKYGKWDKEGSFLDYSLDINPDAENLLNPEADISAGDKDMLTLTDILTYQRGNEWREITFDQNSVKLYKAVLENGKPVRDASGRLIKGKELPTTEWSWKFADNSGDGQWNYYQQILTAAIPDSIALIMEYRYKVQMKVSEGASASLNINNTATLTGISSDSHGTGQTDTWENSGTSSGAKTGGYTFYKVDSNNYSVTLAGAKFALYKYNSETKEYVKQDKTYVSDDRGMFAVNWQGDAREYQFAYNTAYYLIEETAPLHYKLPEEQKKFFFYFSDEQAAEANYPEGFTSDANNLDLSKAAYVEYCENERKDYFYHFTKEDSMQTEQKLPGAVFKAFKQDGTELDIEYTTGADGTFTIYRTDGSFSYDWNTEYYIKEIEAPQGYVLPANPAKYYFYFSNSEGLTPDVTPDYTEGAVDLSQKDEYAVCTNEKQSYTYAFTKTDSVNTNTLLSGAEFTAYKRTKTDDGEFIDTVARVYKTDADGTFEIKWSDGVYELDTPYYVVETKAPEGYQLDESPEKYYFYFSSVIDGSASAPEGIDGTGINLSKENGTQTCVNIVKTYTYDITKIDSDVRTGVKGAKFKVYTADDSQPVKDASYADKEYITDENGRFSVKLKENDFMYDFNKAYYIEESEAPFGYILPENTPRYYFYFSNGIDEVPAGIPAGSVSVDLSKSGQTAECENTREEHTYTFDKVDSAKTDTKLPGAEFTVYKRAADGTEEEVTKYITDENGQFIISWKKGGESSYKYEYDTAYYVVETKAPEHYQLEEKPQKYYFYFASAADSQIPDGVESGYEAKNLSAKTPENVTCTNTKPVTEISVNKIWIDKDSNPLSEPDLNTKSATMELWAYEVPEDEWIKIQNGESSHVVEEEGNTGEEVTLTIKVKLSEWNEEYEPLGRAEKVFAGDSCTYSLYCSWGEYITPTATLSSGMPVQIDKILGESQAATFVFKFNVNETDMLNIMLNDNNINGWSIPDNAFTHKSKPVIKWTDFPAKSLEKAKTLNKDSGWTVTWDDLPQIGYDNEGNVVHYKYFIKERSVNGFTSTIMESKEGVFDVTNTENPDTPTYILPETGGSGTKPYTLGGAMLTVMAAFLMYIKNKRRKEERGSS